jgi:hypothetical protein
MHRISTELSTKLIFTYQNNHACGVFSRETGIYFIVCQTSTALELPPHPLRVEKLATSSLVKLHFAQIF